MFSEANKAQVQQIKELADQNQQLNDKIKKLMDKHLQDTQKFKDLLEKVILILFTISNASHGRKTKWLPQMQQKMQHSRMKPHLLSFSNI